MRFIGYSLAAVICIALVIASYLHLKIGDDDLTGYIEVFGFISGGLSVWLLVKNHILNWPVGIVNGAFFLILFWQSQFFADSLLQIIYIILGFAGWYAWLRGGPQKAELPIGQWNTKQIVGLAAFTVVTTYLMQIILDIKHDAAPFFDAITTVLSLVATYWQMKRVLQNWYIWIIADVIYIPLYAYKHLYLTAIIYIVFMAMCFVGLHDWRKIYATQVR